MSLCKSTFGDSDVDRQVLCLTPKEVFANWLLSGLKEYGLCFTHGYGTKHTEVHNLIEGISGDALLARYLAAVVAERRSFELPSDVAALMTAAPPVPAENDCEPTMALLIPLYEDLLKTYHHQVLRGLVTMPEPPVLPRSPAVAVAVAAATKRKRPAEAESDDDDSEPAVRRIKRERGL
eukprot:c26056_g1_i1.p1 GENE.c26056_g1_i1~~c26056_g1_i1.p1  ORF type:complete len:179 (-),score=25.09 c26056_g1_i1:10-546(-)